MTLQILRQYLQLGLKLYSFRMSVGYLRADHFQTMIASHIQG
jgi:hypothetical protein